MSTVWQKLKDMGLNAVLGAVAWEDTEPEEGIFDSKELDQVISGALAQGLRLIILWFGSFKNVENEVGFHGDSRDRSDAATRGFTSQVPSELAPGIQGYCPRNQTSAPTGTWGDVFGKSVWTDELFMAYHYATYLQEIASAGRKIYGIPLSTNVWAHDAIHIEGNPGIVRNPLIFV
ncbi:glycoside hydrolase [Fusarium proliferatum]|uniref:Glycoside hydrolase n=1 Tax=Gibberella intermedia TaxID=948311 RepID=A0A365MR35_GIBIN|nr:glycoside hydrolase [Fusarium proliferatum]